MTPTVLLLLSIFTVRARGCNDLQKGTVTNLQTTILNETSTGFRQVFPKDYVVPRHVSPNAECHNESATCCVFNEALFLSHSWRQLWQNLESVHLKRIFIGELIQRLDDISKDAWEPPDLSVFPSVHSSPGTLLSLTSSLLSRWVELNCPTGENACNVIHFTTEDEEEKEEEVDVKNEDGGTGKLEEGNIADKKTDLPHVREGERGKRWITVVPTNGFTGSSMSRGLFVWTLFSLRIIMDVFVREL